MVLIANCLVWGNLDVVLRVQFQNTAIIVNERSEYSQGVTNLGKRLRPWRVKFSITRSRSLSVYSIRGIGTYPTLSTRVGRIT